MKNTNTNTNTNKTQTQTQIQIQKKELANLVYCTYKFYLSKKDERKQIEKWIENILKTNTKNSNNDMTATRVVKITNNDSTMIEQMVEWFGSDTLIKKIEDSEIKMNNLKVKKVVSTIICNNAKTTQRKVNKKDDFWFDNLEMAISTSQYHVVKQILIEIAKLVRW